MNSPYYCSTCGAFLLPSSPHTCPPAWLVWGADSTRARAHRLYAVHALDAAEEWARRDDEGGDHAIVGGTPAVCYVVPADATADTVPRAFRVTGQADPVYTAEELDEGAGAGADCGSAA